jgi:2-oxoglutarate ferredoxin oxidoreductase subunit beta
MNTKSMLTGVSMPFCPGCGHGPSVKNISKALSSAGYSPLDVVMVSDIGCSGLVDPLFATHTIHGLHGRSPALGFGVSHGLNDSNKKVIVIQGDGGATIGLQHVLESARRNADMTLVLLNNLIYGMTGGQVSGLSTNEFKEERAIADETPPFDVVKLAHEAGAVFSCRVTSPKNVAAVLEEAFKTPGFSLVEISSLCQPYGAGKMNELESWTEEEEVLRNSRKEIAPPWKSTKSLISESMTITPEFTTSWKGRKGILLAGSAGGGVQAAGKLLAKAGMAAGLQSTMKGEYPITIGTGFSVAEIILSDQKINYTGLEDPDIAIVVTDDGFQKIKDRLKKNTPIIADKKVIIEGFDRVETMDFYRIGRKKGSILSALTLWLLQDPDIPLEALKYAAAQHKYGEVLLNTINQSEDELIPG